MGESNGYAGRKALLSKVQRRYTEVEVDGIGKFRFQSLTAAEASEIANTADTLRPMMLIAKTAVDGEGNLILRETDIDELRKIDSMIINQLVGKVTEHVYKEPEGN